MVWFVVLGALGLRQILDNPAVLEAVSPSCGVQLFLDSPLRALLALGSILLVVTRRGRRPTDPASEAPMVDVGGEAIAPGVHRSPGFAVHLFKEPGMAPPALLDNLRHDHSLHEHTLPVSIDTSDAPHVAQRHKAHYTRVVEGVWQVRLLFVLLDRSERQRGAFLPPPAGPRRRSRYPGRDPIGQRGPTSSASCTSAVGFGCLGSLALVRAAVRHGR